MKTHFKKHQTPWLIFFIGLAIFSLGLSPELVAFQTRFAFFAQEMLQHGIKLFPYTYQGPYPDYPLLPTLLIYLFSWPISQVTSFTAILPTAITSSLILVFIYLLGKTQSERLGIYAVLFALLLLVQSRTGDNSDCMSYFYLCQCEFFSNLYWQELASMGKMVSSRHGCDCICLPVNIWFYDVTHI